MKVLLINGAPRKNGFTTELLSIFKSGVLEAGGDPIDVTLRDLDIAQCNGCFACWFTDKDGTCVQQDDMSNLLHKFLECDAMVLASPIYYYALTSLLKTFLERLFPSTAVGLESVAHDRPDRLAKRHEKMGPKKTVLIALGAMRSTRTMEGAVSTYQLVTDGIGATSAGILLRPEIFFMDFAAGKPVTNRKVREAFKSAGAELIKNGKISDKTQKTAALPFSKNEALFRKHFSTYWTIAKELGLNTADRGTIGKVAAMDLRILMHELASCFDKVAGKDLQAVIQFKISVPDSNWYLSINNGNCEAINKLHSAPTTTMTLQKKHLTEILVNKKDPKVLMKSGAMKISGSSRLAARFSRLFPPPTG